MKRFLAFILAILMLLSATACGTTNESTTDNDLMQTEAATEADTGFFPEISKQDYNKTVFRMIGFEEPGSWYYAKEYSNEDGSIHILNNTIYEMNTLIEEYLNIEIDYEQVTTVVTGGEIFDAV